MGARAERIAAALLFAAAILVWFPGLLAGEAITVADALFTWTPWSAAPPPGFRAPSNKLLLDQIVQNYPWAEYYRTRLLAGELPLWNPYDAGGLSFVANANAGVFSPFHLTLLAATDTSSGLTALAVLKLMVAFAGGRFLARTLGASRSASTISGFAFAFSGPMTVWLGHPLTTALPLLPWLLALAERVARAAGRARIRPAAGLGLVTGLLFVSSHPESAVHGTLIGGAWILVRAWAVDRRRAASTVGLAVLAMTAGLATAGVQVLPFADAMQRSYARHARQTQNPDYRIAPGSLPLGFAPRLYGTPMELTHREELTGGMNFAESCFFAGILPLIFIPAAASALRRDPAQRTLAGFGLAALLVAFDAGGIPSLVLDRIPVLGLGAHHRIVSLWVVAATVLLAPAIDALAEAKTRASRPALALAASAGLAALAWGASRAQAASALSHRTLVYMGFALVLIASATALALTAELLGRRLVIAAAGLLASDLWLFGTGVNPTLAPELVFPPNPLLERLASENDRFRVLALGRALPPNTGLVHGLEDARGYEPLYPKAYEDLWSEAGAVQPIFVTTQPSELRSPRLLPLFGVRHLIAPPGTQLDLPGLATRGESSPQATILRVTEPMPRAYAAFAWDREHDARRAGQRLRGGYPFRSRVLIDNPPDDSADWPERPVLPLDLERLSPERIRIDVQLDWPAVVVILEGHDPGWTVRLDGQPATLLRAYGAFLATVAPAGRHRIELRYVPVGFRAGAWLSAAGVVALAGLGLNGWRRA